MDHADNTKVRSAVGLTVDVGWVMDVIKAIGDCWNGDPDRCTYPTPLRSDRNQAKDSRHILRAVSSKDFVNGCCEFCTRLHSNKTLSNNPRGIDDIPMGTHPRPTVLT
jgi:hypothetical protein